jgi:hypothetical protein
MEVPSSIGVMIAVLVVVVAWFVTGGVVDTVVDAGGGIISS